MKLARFDGKVYVCRDGKGQHTKELAVAGPFETNEGAAWWLIGNIEERLTGEKLTRWRALGVQRPGLDVWLMYALAQECWNGADLDTLLLNAGPARTPTARPDHRERAAGDG